MTGFLAKLRAFFQSPASTFVVLLALFSVYGLGYWRGSRASAGQFPSTTVTDRSTESTKEKQTERQSVAHIYGNEDVVETRLTMPPITLPDGSVRTQTRVTRESAKKETVAAVDTSKSEVRVVERVVEKKVPVHTPCTEAGAATPPRFMVGPAVGRDFDAGKYLFGGSVAARLGPVWLRMAADTRPAVIGSMEVPF